MEQHLMAVAFACLSAALLVVAVLFVRQRRISARLRRRNATSREAGRVLDAELRHLVTSRLPTLVQSLYGRPVEVPGPLDARFAGSTAEQGFQTVMEMFADSVDRARSRADHAAKATLKSMMRGVQSLANEQQLAISTMQDRHDDPYVLEGLLRIDHMNAQIGRRAQANAVLCGSWPGQQRSASSLVDLVRGATSRIRDYLRVDINPQQANAAVVSRVVEPVVLALAELLDNASRHSQPNTSVDVNFQPAHNGIAIVIDDAGVAMDAEELARAGRLLSGLESVDINRLGDPPQVGFAVIGVLAARYGFAVSVDTRSPYGGVRAVLFLPTELLTRLETKPAPTGATPVAGTTPGVTTPPVVLAPPVARTTPTVDATPPAGLLPHADEAPAVRAQVTEPEVTERQVTERQVTANGLPKRRRSAAAAPSAPGPYVSTGEPFRPLGRPPAQATDDRAAADPYPAPPPCRSAHERAAGMGAWQRGTRTGRAGGSAGATDLEAEGGG